MSAAYDAVLFDFGGVFTESPFRAAARHSEELGADPEHVMEIVFGPYHRDTDHPWHRLERGEVTLEAARNEIIELGRLEGLDTDPFQVLATIGVGHGANDAMVERVRRLRAEGYRTALVTNNAREFREGWYALIPVDELFEVVVDSSEVGVRKPDPRIFTHTLELLGGIPANRAVFLDDFDGNITAAEALGMRGILVGVDQTEAIVELDRILGARA